MGTYAGVLAALLSPPFILLCSSFLVFHFLFFCLFVCFAPLAQRDETSEIRCGSSTRLDTLSGLALRLFAVVRLKPGLVEVCQP